MLARMTAPVAPPHLEIRSADDLLAVRRWAFGELAAGRATAAVDAFDEIRPAPDLPGLLDDDPEGPPGLLRQHLDLADEFVIRAAIATEDLALLASVFADRPAGTYFGDPAATLARGIGAQILLEDAMARDGLHARFTTARPLLAIARWSLAFAGGRDGVTEAQEQEALAALCRLGDSVWRESDGVTSLRLAERAPRALRPVRRDLRRLRQIGRTLDPFELLAGAEAALDEIAEHVQPSWPAVGGPWWCSSFTHGCFDVSDPVDEAGRHRAALADVFLELDERMPLEPFDDESAVRHAAHVLALADCALGHAVQSGLAGAPV